MNSSRSHSKSADPFPIVLLVCVLACSLALCACGGSAPSNSTSSASSSSSVEADAPYKLVNGNTLTVATFAGYEPMEYKEGSSITGFDVAVINEVGKRLDLSVSIHDEYADSLLAQIAIGEEYDCAISSILIDEGRAQGIVFTDPYLDSSLTVVVPADSKVTSIEDLSKLSIGAVRGSDAEAWARTNLPDAAYTPFQISSDMFGALDSGTIAAAIYDGPGVPVLLEDRKAESRILTIISTGKGYGIVVNAANPGLAEAIDDALAEMDADGTMAKLKAEWLGESLETTHETTPSESSK